MDFAKRPPVKSNYRIEDILHQSAQQIVYRVTDLQGQSLALIRLIFGEAELGGLEDGVFSKALEVLRQLDHPCLRRVVDGGQDEVDGAPWVVTHWSDGPSVKERHEAGGFDREDKITLEGQARSLIEGLEGFAATIKFDAAQIVGIQALDGSKVETFGIDLREWFMVYARTGDAYFDRNPELGLARLLGSLPVSAPMVSSAVAPPPSPAARQVALSSSGSGASTGITVTMILLAVAVGGGFWLAQKKREPESNVAQSEAVAQVKEKSSSGVVHPAAEPTLRDGRTPSAFPVKENQIPAISVERPPAGEMAEVSAEDSAAMKANVGKWVILTGRVVGTPSNGKWVFEEETEDGKEIIGKLGEGDMSDAIGFKITAVGFLVSEEEFAVVSQKDVEIDKEGGSFEFKEYYTIKNEKKIWELEGERLTLQGKVLRAEKSGSGSTFYLVFTEERPYLAAAIGSDDEKYGVTFKYLESLEGKRIRVTGKAEAERGKKRFILRMSGKDDIEE
ncbi:MAG: hypothetical protein ACON4K_10720 [Akkermansiaceae bacterium]